MADPPSPLSGWRHLWTATIHSPNMYLRLCTYNLHSTRVQIKAFLSIPIFCILSVFISLISAHVWSSLQPRRLSYSRHEIKDEDTNNVHPNNYKVHMQVRRMMSENKNLRKRNKVEAKPSGNSSRNDAHEVKKYDLKYSDYFWCEKKPIREVRVWTFFRIWFY